MKTTRYFIPLVALALAALVCTPRAAKAAQTAVSFDSGSQFLYTTAAKTTLLTAGVLTTTGDGAVLQLGYYSLATTAAPFAGTFIPLSGATSANTPYAYTAIGDLNSNGAGNGQFAFVQMSFMAGSATTGNNLPAAGMPLSIRFFNNTTLAGSTAFNAVSDPTNAQWLWQTPEVPGPTEGLSLDQTGLVWFGGAATAFYTSQAFSVPEPSSLVIAGFVGVGTLFAALRRRQSMAA